MTRNKSTSWETASSWYKKLVGKKGQHYHKAVILPHLLQFLAERKVRSVLDLGCGSGVLARHLPETIKYCGIDIAPSLIAEAKKSATNAQQFLTCDIASPLDLGSERFDAIVVLLALQNVEKPQEVFANARRCLNKKGVLILILNHPCFRIPRQSHWQIDLEKKSRLRCIERYLTPMKIPIQTQPSKGKASSTTWSFHHPLSDYSRFLFEEGFCVVGMREWCSDKQSQGKYARMENRSRKEIPLFLALIAELYPFQ